MRRHSVAAASETVDAAPAPGAGHESDRLLGTLVHRLVSRFRLDPITDVDAAAAGLLNPREVVDILDSRDVCRRAASAYRQLCAMAEVRDVYRGGAALHEVPFTMLLEGRIVRGTIDCLVVTGDAISVLEFKTGRARPEHAVQAELYGKAVQALYPGHRVDLRVIYLENAVI
jgi:ATP-dependent helicase/nuclease subunit A